MPDPLLTRAEADLCVEAPGEPRDMLVWEHSVRVEQLARAITRSPELSGMEINVRALTAAALYHDGSWVLRTRAGEVHPRDMLLRPVNDLHRELAADWLMERLGDVLDAGTLTASARAVRQMNNRRTQCIEAQIIAEADNLDEIGPQAIGLMLRKQRAEGKTLAEMLAVWQRQEEYHYWAARIKDSFRFASVKRLAESRLESLRRFMFDLRASVTLEDITLAAEISSEELPA